MDIRLLGEGRFGKVTLVREKSSGFLCALKAVNKAEVQAAAMLDQLSVEIRIHLRLHDPNIITLYGFFADTDQVYILLEYVGSTTLAETIAAAREPAHRPGVEACSKPVKDSPGKGYAFQLCSAVSYLHSLDIIHRDIKPENIIVHQHVLKLFDFGCCAETSAFEMRSTFYGSPMYVCPEILLGQNYDKRADIWSLGATIYEMLVGEPPFVIHEIREMRRIVTEDVSYPATLDQEAVDFLRRCLTKDFVEREPTTSLMVHPFIVKDRICAFKEEKKATH